MDRQKRISGWWFWLMASIILTTTNVSWAAGEVTIKMATLAPQGSEWHQVLQEMGAAWEKASRGQVVFRLYPGGVAGDGG